MDPVIAHLDALTQDVRALGFRAPHAVYVTGEDALRLTVFNALTSVVVSVRGSFLHVDGRIEPFDRTLTPATDRTASTLTFQLGEGWLLRAHVFATTATPLLGQTFAVLSLVHGLGSAAVDLATLVSDYVTSTQPLAWPGSALQRSLAGAGALRVISGTTPAAGAEISETVPTGARWTLLQFSALFTASVAAATRNINLYVDDGTTRLAYFPQFQTITASGSGRFYWEAGMGFINASLNSALTQGLSTDLALLAGWRIRTETNSIQGADAWTAVRYIVREWIEGL